MKIMALAASGFLALALAAGGVTIARADVITFGVSGTFTPYFSPAACTSSCALGGTIVIDNSSGASNNGIVSEDVTTTGFSPSVGTFTMNRGVFNTSGMPQLVIGDSAGDQMALTIATPTGASLVGFIGGGFSESFTSVFGPSGSAWTSLGGGLLRQPPTNVPEPSSLALLGTALFGIGMAVRRRTARENKGLERADRVWAV